MKLFLIPALLGLALTLNVAHAEGEKTPQQSKMGTCNKAADGKKGDERKAFMKECLSAKAPVAEVTKSGTQQEKMKDCNAQAKGLKGDERKAKMSACLKG